MHVVCVCGYVCMRVCVCMLCVCACVCAYCVCVGLWGNVCVCVDMRGGVTVWLGYNVCVAVCVWGGCMAVCVALHMYVCLYVTDICVNAWCVCVAYVPYAYMSVCACVR